MLTCLLRNGEIFYELIGSRLYIQRLTVHCKNSQTKWFKNRGIRIFVIVLLLLCS